MAESRASSFRPPSLFSRLFPVPKFLKMPAAGLEISDYALRAVVLEAGKDGGRVVKKARRILPEGAVHMGEILKKDILAKELQAFAKELKLRYVHATVPDEKAYLFKVQIPKVTAGEIRQNVEFKLDENIPIPPSEVIFEYADIFREKHIGSEHLDVSVSAMPRDAVLASLEVLRMAGLEPLSFYTPSEALLQALVPAGDRKTYLLIHFGGRKTLIAVAAEGVIRYATTISIGSETLSSALMRSFSISSEEADVMLGKKSFIKNSENADFYAALLSSVSVISDEARKVMAYWDNHSQKTNEVDQQIAKVFLTGTDATLRGLDEYLSVELHARTETGNVWANLLSLDSTSPSIPLADSLEYAVPIGLASFNLFT